MRIIEVEPLNRCTDVKVLAADTLKQDRAAACAPGADRATVSPARE